MDLSFSWKAKAKYKGFSGRFTKWLVALQILRKGASVPTLASLWYSDGVMALGSKVTAWIPGERSVQKTP